MMFMKFDHGAILRKETGLDTPKIVRFLIGNPLIMKEMAKHVPDAGSYAPVTILVDERLDGVHLSYDKMTALLAPYASQDALAVARDLDSKIEDLLLLLCHKRNRVAGRRGVDLTAWTSREGFCERDGEAVSDRRDRVFDVAFG